MDHIFVSHSGKDADIISRLRGALEGQGVPTWVDVGELTAGQELAPEIREAISEARHFVAVLSPAALESDWVHKEIAWAREVARERKGWKVIPLLVEPVGTWVLAPLFGEEPVGLPLPVTPGGLTAAMPELLAALGLQAKAEPRKSPQPEAAPVAELVLELAGPTIEESAGTRRAAARAKLRYTPPEAGARVASSSPYRFTTPLGAIESEEIAWYLERYPQWPTGVFRDRALEVERRLPEWGEALHRALATEGAREVLAAWRGASDGALRRFTVQVDRRGAAGGEGEEGAGGKAEANGKDGAGEAATDLLALPWELLRDGEGDWVEGMRGTLVRRSLASAKALDPLVTEPPLRVLLVSPRPEDERAAYLDHRVSARPLIEALEPLGELVELELLDDPNFAAFKRKLDGARLGGRPFHVVHFDGSGVYDRRHGLGALCFEDVQDAEKLEKRRTDIVDASKIAAALQDARVPLFVLEACESARAEEDPTASVAGRLLEGGVASVVAMSHTVLVETARRFVAVFYRELMAGRRVGEAVLAGRQALKDDPHRGRAFTGDLELQDWFVPVLFQEELDPQLLSRLPGEPEQEVAADRRRLALGALPPEPPHGFVGRSRELLAAERLLHRHPYAVLLGEGGEGKTTLGCELARWRVATRRSERAAFVSLETHPDARAVLNELGPQLVPGFGPEAMADLEKGLQLVERALSERRTVLVLDNLESVLPGPAPGENPPPTPPLTKGGSRGDFSGSPEAQDRAGIFEPKVLEDLLALFQRLGRAGETRLVFTSREVLPEPFAGRRLRIGRLAQREAVELVKQVLEERGSRPAAGDEGSEEEVAALVEAVGCHARSLVLLAREVAEGGVKRATAEVRALMQRLAEKYPDDRERSLFASVELSLARLPAETRERVRRLAVFEGGGQGWVIAQVLGLDYDNDEELELARQLEGVGLAEQIAHGHVRLHPALGPYLERELGEEELAEARTAWTEATVALVGFLYRQQNKDPQLAATLTLLELPNLLAALEHLVAGAVPEQVVAVATQIEGLLQNLGRPKALGRAARVRAAAAEELGAWSKVASNAVVQAIERALDAGRYGEAVAAARDLVQRATTAGGDAYKGAAYDLAGAHFVLGRALEMSGAAGEALVHLGEARQRFEKLSEAGNDSAARMASVSLTETGDCMRALGRLDEAVAVYEKAIELAEAQGDLRDVAAGKFQLGTVRMLQRKYAEALAAFLEAKEIFERLGEPGSVATAWHQIAMVHSYAKQYEAAEHAYQQALKLKVQRGDRSGEASTLNELGLLYRAMGRWEEAVRFYRQAAERHLELENPALEGRVRSNAAIALLELERHDEARRELLRAIECKEPFGHAAEPWKTFDILHDLERAVGNPEAAAAARERAVEAFLAYRRDGGENHNPGGRLAALVARAVAAGETAAAAAQLDELSRRPDLPSYLTAVLPALQAILAGSRDPALAADPALDYDDAVELRWLLETLG